MYMEPIVRARAPLSSTRQRLVGTPVLLLSIAVMVPYLALQALWAGAVLSIRGLIALPRTMLTLIDYAGTVAHGR